MRSLTLLHARPFRAHAPSWIGRRVPISNSRWRSDRCVPLGRIVRTLAAPFQCRRTARRDESKAHRADRHPSTIVSRIITLTTDFGTQDAYVGAMKGVMLEINPAVRLVDITHDIAPQDVMEAAYVLRDAACFFPPETVHLAVVDPGVGTARRPVAVRSGNHYYVAPDNGIVPLLLDDAEPEESVVLDRPEYWRTGDVSATFHGRDIFAPAAAHLSRGITLAKLGRAIDDLSPMHWALPITDEEGIQGWIAHIDHFGNCITNVSRELFERARNGRTVRCFTGSAILESLSRTYADVDTGEPLMHFNSGGVLEIAVHAGNAAELLGIRKGDPVNILFRGNE